MAGSYTGTGNIGLSGDDFGSGKRQLRIVGAGVGATEISCNSSKAQTWLFTSGGFVVEVPTYLTSKQTFRAPDPTHYDE